MPLLFKILPMEGLDFLTLEHSILWKKDLVCFAILVVILCPLVEDVRPIVDAKED